MKKLIIGMGSCGNSAGAGAVYNKAKEIIKNNKDFTILDTTGCIGMCYNEVLVFVEDENHCRTTYANVTPQILQEIYNSHILKGKILEKHRIIDSEVNLESDFFGKQKRVVLKNVGYLNPESFSDYEKREGFKALEKALSISKDEVLDMVKSSGLRGRGGGGASTAMKWTFAKNQKKSKKYIICNADEGDPGAFMDRSVLEGNPFMVLEGMLIGAYVIGADEGYIYVRAEYPLAIKHLKTALKKMEDKGILGKNILGSNFSFDLHIKEGAGAFVCGEETALIASIEGGRGVPKKRPPFPAIKGLFGKPTIVNNVETLASIPWILINGVDKYKELGTKNSPGTKVFALAGKIKKSGLVEVPMGTTLREVIFEIGGGIKDGKKFKSVQMGGPSGGCLPAEFLDLPIDYETINQTGAIMGSGGMIVMDESSCMVDVAKYFLTFTQKESCGKCPFCRIGTKRMLEILERITSGKGKMEDLDILQELSQSIKDTTLCGLGQTAPNPVLTTLKYFRDEYIDHIENRVCKAGVCQNLKNYLIDEKKCIGCTICARVCPTKCISGVVKAPHLIDQSECIKCGKCMAACKFDAINLV